MSHGVIGQYHVNKHFCLQVWLQEHIEDYPWLMHLQNTYGLPLARPSLRSMTSQAKFILESGSGLDWTIEANAADDDALGQSCADTAGLRQMIGMVTPYPTTNACKYLWQVVW